MGRKAEYRNKLQRPVQARRLLEMCGHLTCHAIVTDGRLTGRVGSSELGRAG
jgi:hypothetical protein